MSVKSKLMKMPFYNQAVLPWHYLQAVRYGRKYDWPAKNLRVIGVTGTNGKTTTSFMIWKMLVESGRGCGLLTTVGWGGVETADSRHSSVSSDALLVHRTTSTAHSVTPDSLNNTYSEQSLRTSDSPSISSKIIPSRDTHSEQSLRTSNPLSIFSKIIPSRDTHSEQSLKTSNSSSISSKITPSKNASPRQSLDETDDLDARVLHPQIQHMTTESVGILDKRMRAIADAGAEFLVIEVTSHALAQFRTLGVPIEVAVFTNLTHDHLDYHKTFENYRKAKGKLFRQAKNAVINADDNNADYFKEVFKKNSSGEIIEYGVQKGNLRATEVELKSAGVEYACGDMKIKTQIPGEFNVYNSLAAVGVGKILGLSDTEIEKGIYALEAVEGRMTRVDEGQDFTVIVDYAHAPDALEKVFDSVKCDGKIIAVHGGAGQRDHSTRAIRGEILGKNSDVVIITEDDTRDEDLNEIMQMFAGGAEKAGKKLDKDLFLIPNRTDAIKKAVGTAKKGDLVLILGKGHEKTILRPDGEYPFEDIKVARAALEELKQK